MEAYLYASEGGGLIIHPQPSKIPVINKVELFYVDDTEGTTFSFMEKLRAKAYCTNMLMKELSFTLWEDDAQGEGHHPNNKLILTKKAKVDKNGVAVAEFMLTRALIHKTMQGEADAKKLEFYVTVEYYAKKKHSTENIHIDNPLPPINGEVRDSPAETIPKAKNSPAEQKPPSMKEEKGIGDIAVDKAKELWDWLEAKGTIIKEQLPTVQHPDGKSPAVVKETAVAKREDKECCIIDEEFFLTNYEKEFPRYNKQGKLIPLSDLVKVSLRRMFKSTSEYYSNESRCCNKYHIAYMLATAKHETGHSFDPIEEANWLSWNVRKKYFEEMYDPVLGKNEKRRKMAKNNGNTKEGDGAKYYGRGYVQLTWKDNYQKMQDKFGVNLVDNRSNALNHELAVKIMIYGSEKGIFTGVKLANYISDSKKDYVNARRVINGTDEANSIAGYAEKIEKCLKIKECNCAKTQEGSQQKPALSGKIVFFDSGLSEERVSVVSQFTISLLEKAAKNSANDKLIITSTIRSTRKQAEVMYSNESNGNHIRYAAPGREVITVFNAGKSKGNSKEKIISDMDRKIIELSESGQRVSLHCVSKETYSKNNIIDISYSKGVKNPRDLIRELVKDSAVTKIIHPLNNVVNNSKIRYDTKEPAIHVEIKIP
ncbi:hypothetical protein [Chryseobacterium sp. Leaf394]|uniref:hypothetical protein n=1 Tax=Chryseobacterium sp. Leaf394 TaxID=1736361 RepID=UPI0018F85F87|nr:hypothetical protein [Chryseobacterium sp. Leaf394]